MSIIWNLRLVNRVSKCRQPIIQNVVSVHHITELFAFRDFPASQYSHGLLLYIFEVFSSKYNLSFLYKQKITAVLQSE